MKEALFFLFSQHKLSPLLSQELFFFKALYFFLKRGPFLERKFLAFALFSC